MKNQNDCTHKGALLSVKVTDNVYYMYCKECNANILTSKKEADADD